MKVLVCIFALVAIQSCWAEKVPFAVNDVSILLSMHRFDIYKVRPSVRHSVNATSE